MALETCVDTGCDKSIGHGINLHIILNNHFCGIRGHDNLQLASMASEVVFHLRFEISIPEYPVTNVYLGNRHLGGLGGHGGLQMASEVKSDLRFELCNSVISYVPISISTSCSFNKRGKPPVCNENNPRTQRASK